MCLTKLIILAWPHTLVASYPCGPQQFIQANSTALSMSILGTSWRQASIHRAQPSVVLQRAKDAIVFDAGETGHKMRLGLCWSSAYLIVTLSPTHDLI